MNCVLIYLIKCYSFTLIFKLNVMWLYLDIRFLTPHMQFDAFSFLSLIGFPLTAHLECYPSVASIYTLQYHLNILHIRYIKHYAYRRI